MRNDLTPNIASDPVALFENGILKFDSGVQSLPDHSIAQKRVDDFLLLMTLDSTCINIKADTYNKQIDVRM